jgi:hypothetical protein
VHTELNALAQAATLLGYGFNIYRRLELGDGTTSSVIASPEENVTRSVTDGQSALQIQTFQSREEVKSSFASSVSADYSGLCFSAEFDATYGQQAACDETTVYGLFDAAVPLSIVKLNDSGKSRWAASFASDSDVQSLPSAFTPETCEQFFRIFRRYGTHFVTEVSLGGMFRAYSTAHTTAQMDSQQATAHMKLEYKGLFSGGAEASAAWSNLNQSWSASRSITAVALGGDKSIMAKLSTEYGSDNSGAIQEWIKSVAATPEISGFRLARLSQVFSGEVSTEVDKAIDAYLDGCIYLQSEPPIGAEGTFFGDPTPRLRTPASGSLTPPKTIAEAAPRVWLVLIDAAKPLDLQKALLNQNYDLTADADALTHDLEPFLRDNRRLVVVASGRVHGSEQPLTQAPAALEQLFQNCGTSYYKLSEAMSYVGIAFAIIAATGNSDTAAFTYSTQYGSHLEPAKTIVNVLTDPFTIVEQMGGVAENRSTAAL